MPRSICVPPQVGHYPRGCRGKKKINVFKLLSYSGIDGNGSAAKKSLTVHRPQSLPFELHTLISLQHSTQTMKARKRELLKCKCRTITSSKKGSTELVWCSLRAPRSQSDLQRLLFADSKSSVLAGASYLQEKKTGVVRRSDAFEF